MLRPIASGNCSAIRNHVTCAPGHKLHLAFKIPYLYGFITKLYRTLAEAILNRVNPITYGIGQGEARRSFFVCGPLFGLLHQPRMIDGDECGHRDGSLRPYYRFSRPDFFFQVAPQLYSRGWVDPVPDQLLLRKSGSAGNWNRTSGSVARNPDHWPQMRSNETRAIRVAEQCKAWSVCTCSNSEIMDWMMDNLHTFRCKSFNTRHAVTFGISL
jgi:hypothetical protein